MSRPDYVRCETCVYCDGVHGKCRFHPYIGTGIASHGFCHHWRLTWPVEYQGFLVSSDLKTWTLELGVAQPPEVPQVKPVEAETELRPGLYYGGRGPGGETYWKEVDSLETDSLWVREGNELRWTPEDFDAIAADMRAREEASKP